VKTAASNRVRWAERALAATFAALICLLAPAAFGRALEIRGIVLTVSDLERSVAFYQSALGFHEVAAGVVADGDFDQLSGTVGARVRRATLRLGEETIDLEQYLSPTGRPLPVDGRANDLWFQHFAIVVRDMDAAYAQLARQPLQAISTAPQTLPESNPAAAGIRAYKFKDPDGHPLELLYFPRGKGNPKWQRPGTDLFLGIDHSAITVAFTDRSIRFWVDLLGLAVAGGSLNTGPTQEQLDGAPGAVVRVTGLRPENPGGPGLEFLQYLTPSGGRTAPPDTRPSDIAHARVVLEVDDLDRLVEELTRRNATFVSARPVHVPGTPYSRGLMVKDPDGHAVMLVQR
jgi:catechol 2,3-dioxygenase-like lactoylglutathione lyase family enzyme